MPGLAPDAPPTAPTMSVVARIFLVLAAVLALLMTIFRPVSPGDPAYVIGEHLGIFLMVMGLPLLVAWLAAGRTRVRHPNRFALIFCVLSGFFLLLNAATLMANFEAPEQRFSRLMREAAGLQPESHRGFGRQRRFDDAIREQYRRLLQQNRDYVGAVKQMGVSKVQVLNTAEGFANPEAEEQGLQELHALYALDTDQEQKVRVIMGELRHVLENYAGSAQEREAMLRGFDASLAEQLNKRQEAVTSEKAFVDAIDDVHAYARAHRNDFSLVGGQLIFTDPAVQEEFNAKARVQDEKRNAFLTAQRQFNLSQAEILGKMGLNQKDIGAK